MFHFFEDLHPIFKEIARFVKPNGIFAFTLKIVSEDLPIDSYATFYENSDPIFSHSDGYIRQLLKWSGFQRHKELKFFALDDDEKDLLLIGYVVQKIPKGF